MNAAPATPPLPATMARFIARSHVVSLATGDATGLWAASCFYAFDAGHVALIVLTERNTRHGAAMLARPAVAGTIAGQPHNIATIRGVQFAGQAHLLEGAEADAAYATYCQCHPVARLHRADTWLIGLDEIKYTNNANVFAQKTLWQRQTGPVCSTATGAPPDNGISF